MKNKIVAIAAIALLLVSGLGLTQSSNNFNYDFVSRHADKQVTLHGQLSWGCPLLYGAKYPEDCIAVLSNGDYGINLEFDIQTQNLRDKLNKYYNESLSGLVKIKVKGVITASGCQISDSACIETYKLKVIDLVVENEKVPVCSCKKADMNKDGIVDYKDLAICGAGNINKCGACIHHWYGKAC